MKKSCPHHRQDKDILSFFSCCLGDEPAPIPEKVQKLRSTLGNVLLEDTKYQPGIYFQVTPDMIVADLIATFTQIKPYLEDLNPLGMMSPMLGTTSLDLFFQNLDIDLETVCHDLEALINQT